jgi:DNA primase large subunit
MRHLVFHQRAANRHLKFQGQLQLRPFLKEAGFSLQNSLRWWEREMCRDPSISASVFEQKCSYHIHHTYGLRGHGRGAFCFSCKKIMSFPRPLDGQAHGCPFQVLSADDLAHFLPYWGVPSEEVEAIVASASAHSAGHACAKFFQATHPKAADEGPALHPNEFLRRSRRLLEASSLANVDLAQSESTSPCESHSLVHGPFDRTRVARPLLVGDRANRIPRSAPVNVAAGPFDF